ncbi:hypothetical protein BJ138DRAFT_995669 [Hygrophoropsis aurantiaca]|uniref:Uncharacterized protein n=1 Tax=Hygrophoropsis aurantiaca TaxID=72124 RepID=A0ACB8ATX5_9AGAM|nr:hypothetical protein BJ138DRAFT_995669 [Hygrophoropsis aurantiaca]
MTSGDPPVDGSQLTVPSLRSLTSMNGLLAAELGGGMVELDVYGHPGSSGFRAGQRIEPGSFTPGGSSTNRPSTRKAFSETAADQSSLTPSDTFFDVGAAPARSAAELRTVLGNSNSRLKPRASILPPQSLRKVASTGDLGTVFPSVALEKAKSRARIEVDIVLESNTCVQGSHLRGVVKIRVRKCLKKDSPLFLGQGKIRVIGFECIPHEVNRCTFYQRSALLSEVTASSQDIYTTELDEDGWAEAKEGIHVLPFSMLLPADSSCGTPKGILNIHSGVSVRYVAMASIKVKDPKTSKESVAHFYRDCEIWPRLEVATSLASAARPLTSEACRSIFMGGPGKVKLSARLHRLYWVAGQTCSVQFRVVNESKKMISGATISLIRTTTIFKPHPHLAAGVGSPTADPDACQTSTMRKQVAESRMEMGQRCTKGHASAKGWWTGVAPGQTSEFSHQLLLPPDVLSVTRVRLLEVEYTLRVSITAGSMGSDIHVILPIRILNFISLDPVHNSPRRAPEDTRTSRPQLTSKPTWYKKSRSTLIDNPSANETVPGMKYSDQDTTVIFQPVSDSTDDVQQVEINNASMDSASVYPPSEFMGPNTTRNLMNCRSSSEDEINQVLSSESRLLRFVRGELPSSGSIQSIGSGFVPHPPRGPRSEMSTRMSQSIIHPSTVTCSQGDEPLRPASLTSFAQRVRDKLQAAHASDNKYEQPIPHGGSKMNITPWTQRKVESLPPSSVSRILPKPPLVVDFAGVMPASDSASLVTPTGLVSGSLATARPPLPPTQKSTNSVGARIKELEEKMR